MSADLVVVGVGSNLDEPVKNLRQALAALKKIENIKVLRVAGIYESKAQIPKDGPAAWSKNFLNSAISLEVNNLTPFKLLAALKKIEFQMGRQSNEVWAPRIIDLDILYWQGLRVNEKNIKIPHPSLGLRPFALLPLLELVPHAEIERPSWAQEWIMEKPFETIKSKKYFWPKLVGIVNLTADSFSDGGQLFSEEKILTHIKKLIGQGAEVLDFGAESTRPNAIAVELKHEWQKLEAALKLVKQELIKTEISIDTYHSETMQKCLQDFKITYINDVSGLRDVNMIQLMKDFDVKAVVMQSLSVPPKPAEIISELENPIFQLTDWWNSKLHDLKNRGVKSEKLIFDPGVGFGKSKSQNLFILKNLHLLHQITNDIFIGHSRKSYQTLFSDRVAANRDLETALSTSQMNMAYAQFLRVHDIESQSVALSFQ